MWTRARSECLPGGGGAKISYSIEKRDRTSKNCKKWYVSGCECVCSGSVNEENDITKVASVGTWPSLKNDIKTRWLPAVIL